MPITSDNLGYEALNGLGDWTTDISSPTINTFDWTTPISTPIVSAPTDWTLPISTPIVTPSFNWDNLWGNLIGAGAKTGLQIASNVTNPAYNTPGAYTRLADGTIIATAGNPIANPASILGGSGGGTLLLLGGALLLIMVMGKR